MKKMMVSVAVLLVLCTVLLALPANAMSVAVSVFGNGGVYAQTYVTATFDAQGGYCAVDSAEVDRGDQVGELPLAIKACHVFIGWFTSPGDAGEQITSDSVLQEDITLYAHWSAGVSNQPFDTEFTDMDGRKIRTDDEGKRTVLVFGDMRGYYSCSLMDSLHRTDYQYRRDVRIVFQQMQDRDVTAQFETYLCDRPNVERVYLCPFAQENFDLAFRYLGIHGDAVSGFYMPLVVVIDWDGTVLFIGTYSTEEMFDEMFSMLLETLDSLEGGYYWGLPGDINMDRKVNTKDLARLAKYLAGEDVEVDKYALDVNGDGKINMKDYVRLLRYLSGEDVDMDYYVWY